MKCDEKRIFFAVTFTTRSRSRLYADDTLSVMYSIKHMADTIIHETRERSSGGAGEWIVAVVIVAAIIIIGFMLYRVGLFSAVPVQETGGTDINVTIPAPEVGGSAEPTE